MLWLTLSLSFFLQPLQGVSTPFLNTCWQHVDRPHHPLPQNRQRLLPRACRVALSSWSCWLLSLSLPFDFLTLFFSSSFFVSLFVYFAAGIGYNYYKGAQGLLPFSLSPSLSFLHIFLLLSSLGRCWVDSPSGVLEGSAVPCEGRGDVLCRPVHWWE